MPKHRHYDHSVLMLLTLAHVRMTLSPPTIEKNVCKTVQVFNLYKYFFANAFAVHPKAHNECMPECAIVVSYVCDFYFCVHAADADRHMSLQ